MATKQEQLFDVVVYDIETGEIVSIAGTQMRLDTGFHNAEKRLDTVLMRMREDYNAAIVEAGKCKVGDKLIEE